MYLDEQCKFRSFSKSSNIKLSNQVYSNVHICIMIIWLKPRYRPVPVSVVSHPSSLWQATSGCTPGMIDISSSPVHLWPTESVYRAVWWSSSRLYCSVYRWWGSEVSLLLQSPGNSLFWEAPCTFVSGLLHFSAALLNCGLLCLASLLFLPILLSPQFSSKVAVLPFLFRHPFLM